MTDTGYFVLAVGLVLGTCDPRPDCRTEAVAEYAAPGGAATAIVSHEICSNYPSSLHVELDTERGRPEGSKHTLLILDCPMVNDVLRRPQVSVQWEDAERVLVRYDTSVRMIFWGGSRVGRVSVRYAPIQ